MPVVFKNFRSTWLKNWGGEIRDKSGGKKLRANSCKALSKQYFKNCPLPKDHGEPLKMRFMSYKDHCYSGNELQAGILVWRLLTVM